MSRGKLAVVRGNEREMRKVEVVECERKLGVGE